MASYTFRSPVKGPTIALVQFSSIPLHPSANFEKAAQHVREAAASGADIVIFPEYFLTGRFTGSTTEIDEEGVWVAKFQELASTHKVDIVPGTIIERMKLTDSVLKNTAYYIDHRGEILGRYQKINLFPLERNFLIPGARKQSQRVFHTRWGIAGLLISWDLMYPETCRALFASSHDLAGRNGLAHRHIKPSHDDGLVLAICPSSWTVLPEHHDAEIKRIDAVCLTRAFENHIAFVFCNSAKTAAVDETHTGRSQVCLPLRGTLAKVETDKEEVLIARELDLGSLKEAESVFKLREDLYETVDIFAGRF